MLRIVISHGLFEIPGRSFPVAAGHCGLIMKCQGGGCVERPETAEGADQIVPMRSRKIAIIDRDRAESRLR